MLVVYQHGLSQWRGGRTVYYETPDLSTNDLEGAGQVGRQDRKNTRKWDGK